MTNTVPQTQSQAKCKYSVKTKAKYKEESVDIKNISICKTIFARPAILWITSEPDSRSCALKRN